MTFAVVIDVIFSIALFINAALFLPQVTRLLKTKNSDGLSIITFGGFNFIQLSGVLHGIMRHDYVLVIGFGLSLFTCGAVSFLILRYRNNS